MSWPLLSHGFQSHVHDHNIGSMLLFIVSVAVCCEFCRVLWKLPFVVKIAVCYERCCLLWTLLFAVRVILVIFL